MIKKTSYQDIIRIPMLTAAGFGIMFYWLGYQDPFDLDDKILNQYLIGAGIGGLIALVSFKANKFDSTQMNYFAQLAIRVLFITLLFSQVYFHFWFDKIPDINIVAQKDIPFKDISSLNLQRLINELSPAVLKFEAYTTLAAILLLVKRKTAIFGFGILATVFFFRIITSIDPSSDMHRSKILLGICLTALLPYLEYLYNYWVKNQPITKSDHPVFKQDHLYGTISSLKYYILIGLFVMKINQPNRYYNYYANNAKSPIKGAWTIKDINLDFNKSGNQYETLSLLMADRIYLSSSRYGKIRMKDTLSTFEYLVDPTNNQFELWNFNDYRKLDLKGKFEYLSDDTIRFYGKNAKDPIEFTMVLDEGIEVK